MKISRRNFCLLMAGACCTSVLAACGSSSSSTASSSAASASAAASGEVRDELIFVNYRDIRDLNPHLYAGEMYAQSILYDTLVSITADGYEGCLAESWDHQRGWLYLHLPHSSQCSVLGWRKVRCQCHSCQLQRHSGKPANATLGWK